MKLEARAAMREEVTEKGSEESSVSHLCHYDISQLNDFASLADSLMFGALAEDTVNGLFGCIDPECAEARDSVIAHVG